MSISHQPASPPNNVGCKADHLRETPSFLVITWEPGVWVWQETLCKAEQAAAGAASSSST